MKKSGNPAGLFQKVSPDTIIKVAADVGIHAAAHAVAGPAGGLAVSAFKKQELDGSSCYAKIPGK